jgi:Opioid growth factor receptor (OGFr) conserved region.
VRFYLGLGADHRGRRLATILAFTDRELEDTHDYIQWLFPLATPSGVMPDAPLVDDTCRNAFRQDAALRGTLRGALARMLAFYGLAIAGSEDAPIIVESPSFLARAAEWLTPHNHNFLRLTRIMSSLALLGEPKFARALQAALERIYARHARTIGPVTIAYWRGAVAEVATANQDGVLPTTLPPRHGA